MMMNMTRRVGLALALAVLGSAPTYAIMITGYVGGQITLNRSGGGPFDPPVYHFTPGEGLYITYSFETSRVENPGGSGGDFDRYAVVPASFVLSTSGGYTASGQSSQFLGGDLFVRNGATDSLVFWLGTAGSNITLSLIDPTGMALSSTAIPTQEQLTLFTEGSVTFNRERQNADENFVASVRSLPSPLTVPIPEPSTFTLGGLGLAFLGLGYARGRLGRASN